MEQNVTVETAETSPINGSEHLAQTVEEKSTLSEVEKLRLENANLKALFAQVQGELVTLKLQRHVTESQDGLKAQMDTLRKAYDKAEGWTIDLDTGQWVAPDSSA